VQEAETERVRRLLRQSTAAISRLTEVELVSALARRHREGSLPKATLEALLAAIEEEVSTLPVVEVSPAVVRLARALLLRHALRAGDAIQLASSLVLRERLEQAVHFLAFDERLNEAARREGLPLAAL
jgi:predicted nucleic acid-binding protein